MKIKIYYLPEELVYGVIGPKYNGPLKTVEIDIEENQISWVREALETYSLVQEYLEDKYEEFLRKE